MMLHAAPDGRTYGRYVPLGDGRFGFLPLIMAVISAIPKVISAENPTPGQVGYQGPPSNAPLLIAAGLGGIVVLGGLTYLLVKA